MHWLSAKKSSKVAFPTAIVITLNSRFERLRVRDPLCFYYGLHFFKGEIGPQRSPRHPLPPERSSHLVQSGHLGHVGDGIGPILVVVGNHLGLGEGREGRGGLPRRASGWWQQLTPVTPHNLRTSPALRPDASRVTAGPGDAWLARRCQLEQLRISKTAWQGGREDGGHGGEGETLMSLGAGGGEKEGKIGVF